MGQRYVTERPLFADLILLAAVVLAFLIGLGRFVWLAAALVSADQAPGGALTQPALRVWWGPRDLPHAGDDFLTVLERRGTLEAANEMVGAVLLRHLKTGGDGVRLIVPTDLDLMSDEVLRLVLEQADGSSIVKEVPVFDLERLERVSPLPVVSEDYDPALTSAELSALPEQAIHATYPHGWATLIAPPRDPQGVFVLHTMADRQGIILVPQEYSPTEVNR